MEGFLNDKKSRSTESGTKTSLLAQGTAYGHICTDPQTFSTR